jgi:succinylglutamate desuccinylase/aspartoacylase family protein
VKKILLLGRHHGNEPLDDVLKTYIHRYKPHLLPYITFKTANLKAKRLNVRFIEGDMNRSYDDMRNTYESRRAAHVSKFIRAHNFDLVLDLHTTNCIQPPCLLVRGINPQNTDFLRASHIDKIVDIQHEIAETSLIGTFSNSVSIEVMNKDLDNFVLISNLVHDIERYILGITFSRTKTLYCVSNLLLKSEINGTDLLKNFEITSQGFIPILTGENSYKKDTHYIGFRSDKAVQIKV